MVPSVGDHQFIYRLLHSNHLPLEQKSTEVLWNCNFYYRVWKYPRRAEIETPCLCVYVCAYTCAFLLTCIIIEVSFLQALDYSFAPAILRPRVNQATVCKKCLILTQKVRMNIQSFKEHLNLSGAYDLCLILTVHSYSYRCSLILKKKSLNSCLENNENSNHVRVPVILERAGYWEVSLGRANICH